MARPDFTARKRDELLRQHREQHDLRDETLSHLEGPEGGYTARLARELRAQHGTGNATDPDWLQAHRGAYQGPLTWNG